MQQTRQFILDILRDRGAATVDEITAALSERIQQGITAVTVRHHLDVLRGDDLVTKPALRRSGSRGRPQLVYELTPKAREMLPNNYQHLAAAMLNQLKDKLPPTQVNVIIEGVADHMVSEIHFPADATIEERLTTIINYLNEHGYEASWQPTTDGFILQTRNCPYHAMIGDHSELCTIDMRLISSVLGIVPRSLGRIASDEQACTYLIPYKNKTAQLA